MKAFDIYACLDTFLGMIDSEALSPNDKLAFGREMLTSLPPKMMCVSSPFSFDIAEGRMKAELEKLRAGIAAEETKPEAGQEAGQAESKTATEAGMREAGKGSKSVRKASGK